MQDEDFLELALLLVILLPIAVLHIILFFKVWGMANNTKKIRTFLEAQRPDLIWNDFDERYKEKKED